MFCIKDAESKEKGKLHGDAKRKAIYNDVHVGDTVLLKQNANDKLITYFSKRPVSYYREK